MASTLGSASRCGCRAGSRPRSRSLACSRNGYVCCPSLHRGHTAAEVAALIDRMRAVALIAAPGYGADGDRHDIFAALADSEFLRVAWPIGPADAPPFAGPPGEPPAAPCDAAASRDPNQIIYLAFTSGTTGKPERRLAQRQHAARHRPDDGRRLAARACRALQLSPLRHNLGTWRAGDGTGRGRRAGAARFAAQHQPDRSAGGDRRPLSVRRADPRDRPHRRVAPVRRQRLAAVHGLLASRAPRRRRRLSRSCCATASCRRAAMA